MSIPPGVEQRDGAGRDLRGPAAVSCEQQWAFEDAKVEWSSLSPESKHERILCAAGQVFSKQGLDAPMPAVAAAASAGVGSLYRQFPSKRDLLAALVVRRLDHIGEAARAAAAAPDGEHWQALREMLWMVVQNHQADDFLGEAIAIVFEHPNVTAAMTRAQDQIDAMLQATIAEGELRADATALDIRLVFNATRAARRMEPGAWERMLTLMIDGLRVRHSE